MILIEILLIVGLVKLQIETERPFLCSGIYAMCVFVLGLMFGHDFLVVLLFSTIGFVLASGYFWLLDRFPNGILWWAILIIGMPIVFF